MKIVINKCYGGFGLSQIALLELHKNGSKIVHETELGLGIDANDYKIRNDPDLIQTIENWDDDANSDFSKLKIVEIPDDAFWELRDYDGYEYLFWSMSKIHKE